MLSVLSWAPQRQRALQGSHNSGRAAAALSGAAPGPGSPSPSPFSTNRYHGISRRQPQATSLIRHACAARNLLCRHRLSQERGARLWGMRVSMDGARMKAKRKGWRIIPGNPPNDTVRVELRSSELKLRVPGEQRERLRPEQATRTMPKQPNIDTDRFLSCLSEAVGLLRPAQEQIERLQAQLVEAKEAHHRDAMDLVATEAREIGTKAELERALADLVMLQRDVVRLKRPWWRWR